MEDEIIDTIRATSKSPEGAWAPSDVFEGLQQTVCDYEAKVYKSLDERTRTWYDSCQSVNFEKMKMIKENKFNSAVNNDVKEMIGHELMEMQDNNQICEENVNELFQKRDEIEKQFEPLNFNHIVLSYQSSSLSRCIKNSQEWNKSLENDMKDTLTILESVTEENRRRSQSLDEIQSEMSEIQEDIDDLCSKLTEEKFQYEYYLEETQELDRTEAELEILRILLKDNNQTVVDLETEEANTINLLGDREKTLEKKLFSIKQLPRYLANNMKVIDEWKAKNQIKISENEKMREMCEKVYEKMKIQLDDEMETKEKKIAKSLDSMKVQEVEEANENLVELDEILSISQQRTKEELKVKKKELEEAKKQSLLIDKKVAELADLEQNIELEQFMHERRLERRRQFRLTVSGNEGFRSPILGTPDRMNMESP